MDEDGEDGGDEQEEPLASASKSKNKSKISQKSFNELSKSKSKANESEFESEGGEGGGEDDFGDGGEGESKGGASKSAMGSSSNLGSKSNAGKSSSMTGPGSKSGAGARSNASMGGSKSGMAARSGTGSTLKSGSQMSSTGGSKMSRTGGSQMSSTGGPGGSKMSKASRSNISNKSNVSGFGKSNHMSTTSGYKSKSKMSSLSVSPSNASGFSQGCGCTNCDCGTDTKSMTSTASRSGLGASHISGLQSGAGSSVVGGGFSGSTLFSPSKASGGASKRQIPSQISQASSSNQTDNLNYQNEQVQTVNEVVTQTSQREIPQDRCVSEPYARGGCCTPNVISVPYYPTYPPKNNCCETAKAAQAISCVANTAGVCCPGQTQCFKRKNIGCKKKRVICLSYDQEKQTFELENNAAATQQENVRATEVCRPPPPAECKRPPPSNSCNQNFSCPAPHLIKHCFEPSSSLHTETPCCSPGAFIKSQTVPYPVNPRNHDNYCGSCRVWHNGNHRCI